MPVTITYDNTSILNNMDNFGLSVNSVLIRYINDVYIESIVVLTLLRNMTINGAGLDCAIGDLDNNLINIFVNTSGWYYLACACIVFSESDMDSIFCKFCFTIHKM